MTKKSKSNNNNKVKMIELILKPQTLLVISILITIISLALAYIIINNLLVSLMALISICVPIISFYFIFKLIFKR